MKKKFGIVLVVVMMMSVLSVALVACKSEVSELTMPTSDALTEVITAWIKGNNYQYAGMLGWDTNTRVIGESSDITVSFKGGIKEQSENTNKMQFSVIDNINKSTIFAITADEKALYLDFGEGARYEVTDINIATQTITGESASGAVEIMQTLVPLVFGMFAPEQATVTVSESENETYDKSYNISFDVPDTVVRIVSLVGGLVGMDDVQISNVSKDLTSKLEGAVFDLDLKTTGNTKVKTPKEDREDKGKYTYSDGKLAVDGIKITTGNASSMFNVVVSNVNLMSDVPSITVPTGYTRTKLLQFKIDGEFDMKGVEDVAVADYEYRLEVLLDAKAIFNSIVKVIKTNSINPLIEEVFSSDDSRIVFDIYHKCDKNCTIEHLAKNFEGSILTIAYDPSKQAFDNNRVYVAIHPRAILTKEVYKALGIEGLAPVIGAIIPKDYISYAISPTEVLKLNTAEGKGLYNNKEKKLENLDVKSMISELVDRIIKANMSGGVASIDYSSMRAVVVKYYGEESVVVKVLDALLPGVVKMQLKATLNYGAPITESGLQSFMEADNSGKVKSFTFSGKNVLPMKGDMSPKLDKSGNIDLAGAGIDYYNPDGSYKPISATEIKSLIGKEFVQSEWKDINGLANKSVLKVVAMAGLDENKFGEEQEITLGLSYSTNPDYSLKSLMIAIDKILSNSGLNVDTVDYVVKTKIILTEQVGDIRFTQDGLVIGGEVVPNDRKFDADKVYAYGEVAPELTYNAVIEYTGGKVKIYTAMPNTNVVNNGEIVTAKTTDIGYNIFNNKHTIKLKMNDNLSSSSVDIKLVAGGQYIIDTQVTHTGLGHIIPVPREIAKTFYDKLVADYPDAEITQTSSILAYKGMTLTFSKSGVYKGEMLFDSGATIYYSIEVK